MEEVVAQEPMQGRRCRRARSPRGRSPCCWVWRGDVAVARSCTRSQRSALVDGMAGRRWMKKGYLAQTVTAASSAEAGESVAVTCSPQYPSG